MQHVCFMAGFESARSTKCCYSCCYLQLQLHCATTGAATTTTPTTATTDPAAAAGAATATTAATTTTTTTITTTPTMTTTTSIPYGPRCDSQEETNPVPHRRHLCALLSHTCSRL